MTRTTRLVTLAALAAIALPSHLAIAGDLTPPAGPISPTFKTLSEVEPRIAISSTNTPGDADSVFRLTSNGSYYLTGTISAAAGRVAIEIDGDDITLDLNGFRIRGSDVDVIRVNGNRRGVTIRNGSISNTLGIGVNAATATDVLIEDISVRTTGGNGIVAGDRARIQNCAVNDALIGIVAGENSVVQNCTSESNASHGFDIDQGSVISRCTASNNLGRGIYHRGRGSIVESSALANGEEGIRAENTTTVQNCTSSINTGRGIFVSLNANVRGCATWDNESDGIVVGNHSVVANNTSTNNTGVGIQATNNSTVIDNTSSFNTSHGIRIFGETLVSRNNCTGNGFSTGAGSGILASGDNNRIDENNCTNNSSGVEVTGAGNIILRNTCAGNVAAGGGNFVIVAGNAVGTIVNAAGATVTTTATYANLEF
jgi:parallel beta-helix repeat protein